MQYITEQEIDRITSDTCRARAKEKKVRLHIEPVNGETAWEGGINGHFFRVKTGETVEVPDFDENRWNECSTGIHFFITRQEAVNY